MIGFSPELWYIEIRLIVETAKRIGEITRPAPASNVLTEIIFIDASGCFKINSEKTKAKKEASRVTMESKT